MHRVSFFVLFLVTFIYLAEAEFVCLEITGVEDSFCSDYADSFPERACVDTENFNENAEETCTEENLKAFNETCPKKNDMEAYCTEFRCSYVVACETDEDCESLNAKQDSKPLCFDCCLECFDEEDCEEKVELGLFEPADSTDCTSCVKPPGGSEDSPSEDSPSDDSPSDDAPSEDDGESGQGGEDESLTPSSSGILKLSGVILTAALMIGSVSS